MSGGEVLGRCGRWHKGDEKTSRVDELQRVGAVAAAQYLVARLLMNVPSAWLKSALNTSTGRRHRLVGGCAEEGGQVRMQRCELDKHAVFF